MKQSIHQHEHDAPGTQDERGGAPAGTGPQSAIIKLIAAGFEASGAAVALFGPDDTIAFASPSFVKLYAVQPDASTFSDIMRHCYQIKAGPVFSTDIDTWLERAQEKRRSAGQRAFEIDMRDGRWFWANETNFAGGWLLLVATEISVLKSNERMLQLARDAAQLAANTDALTGVFNRRYAMEALDNAIRTASIERKDLSVALIDLDNFKGINDRFGHMVGDRVLCHFTAACQRVLRKKDTFARIGGEEFLLIMPGTILTEAATGVDRLSRHIETSGREDGLETDYTFSAGLALLSEGDMPERLLHRADRALYRAKHLGRNRIEMADEDSISLA
ncbi:sensor domain-containing diguanylate cyclase [Pararhizobium sp.]|uniref:sensor domain-containing diguanylate cyclase n=1 Tax=Pararhizobium sp. TaxID=1977563 RepID=UPI00271904C0|nr:GGDEF domain-containing protein [Pararhizobium sp.]MDO9417200.1 GGDEF domain-containing protein [Pararhizobium sp.]